MQMHEDSDGEHYGGEQAVHAAEEEQEARATAEQHEKRGAEADKQRCGRPSDHVVEASECSRPLERRTRDRSNLCDRKGILPLFYDKE